MILAVTGGKGGVGKSTVAYNLAAELDAVAVDADLGMADLPADRGPDLHDVLAGRASPIEAVREGGSVAILPCGRSLAGARAGDPVAIVDALRDVEREYGRVVVDCPAGLRADAGLPLYAASASVLVTTPEHAALSDALRTRELARELDAGLVRIVCNRAGDATPTAGIERRLGAPVVRLPDSEAVADSRAAGRPLCSAAPDSLARERIATLARSVLVSLRS